MRFTKRQKALLGIFVIGLLALTMDRTFLRPQGGASAASADPLRSSDESILPSDNIPALVDKPERPGAAERLSRLWSDQDTTIEQMRDAFSLPASWSDKLIRDEVGFSNAAASFVREHTLTAVVVNGRDSYVLLDDHLLVPGQCLDGFTLVSVGGRTATFELDGQRVVLELANR